MVSEWTPRESDLSFSEVGTSEGTLYHWHQDRPMGDR